MWINTDKNKNTSRDILYNRIVALDRENLNTMIDNFDGFFNQFVNFTEQISSLRLYPFEISVGKIGKLKTLKGSVDNVIAGEVPDNMKHFNIGTFFVNRYFNNFADFKGYTQIKLYLPFLGLVDVDVNECMGKYIVINLFVDLFSGAGMYTIGVNDAPLYATARIISTYDVNIGIEIPLGTSNASDIQRNLLLGTVKTAIGIGASVALSNPMPAVATSTISTSYEHQARGTAKYSRLKTVAKGSEETTKTTTYTRPKDYSKVVSDSVESSIDILNRNYSQGHTDRVNDSRLLWNTSLNVYVIIYRPKFIRTDMDEYNHLFGSPLGEVLKLQTVKGFTTISNIHIEGNDLKNLTKDEYVILSDILNDGIILPDLSVQVGQYSFKDYIDFNYLDVRLYNTIKQDITFTSNGKIFDSITFEFRFSTDNEEPNRYMIYYNDTLVYDDGWLNENFKIININSVKYINNYFNYMFKNNIEG